MARRRRNKLISIETVAEMTTLAVRTIKAKKCGTDELLRITLGRKVVFVLHDVQAWIDRRVEAARIEREMEAPPPPDNVRPLRLITNEQINEALSRFKEVK